MEEETTKAFLAACAILVYFLPATSHALDWRNVLKVDARGFAAGTHEVAWDGRDDLGHPAASGVYLVRLTTPSATITQRATLLR